MPGIQRCVRTKVQEFASASGPVVPPQPGRLEATCCGQAAGVEETSHHRPGSLRKPRSLEGGRPAAVPGDRHVATPARTGTPGTFCARADAHRLLLWAIGA